MYNLKSLLRAGTNISGYDSPQAVMASAVTAIKKVFNQESNYTSLRGSQIPISMEGFDDASATLLTSGISAIVSDLRAIPELKILYAQREGSKVDECSMEGFDNALATMAYTILSAQRPNDMLAAYRTASDSAGGDPNAVLSSDIGRTPYSLEAFDPASLDKYLGLTAIINALTTAGNQFMDVWFPTEMIPVGNSGYQLDFKIPKIVIPRPRDDSGNVLVMEKISINQAILDPTILESNVTDVFPYAVDGTTPAYLVPAADTPTFNKVFGSTTVPTRPIKFGSEVKNIIGSMASAPGVLNGGAFNFTDSLDRVINIGTVYWKVRAKNGVTEKTSVFATDISNQSGARLTSYPQGQPQEMFTQLDAILSLSTSSTAFSGNLASELTAVIAASLGLTVGAEFEIRVKSTISAKANIEYATWLANANNSEVSVIYGPTGAELDAADLTDGTNEFELTMLGALPMMRRTNSNIREFGTLIDTNYQKSWLFPARLQAPLTTVAPINGQVSIDPAALMQVADIRNSGHCLNVLEATAEILKAYPTNGIPAHSPMPGAEIITPTYHEVTLDLATVVFGMNSYDAVTNVQGHLAAVLKIVVGKLLQDSNYIAGLKACGIADNGYEVIILTDPRLSGYIMTEGDMRTFGDERSYRKATTPLLRVKNVIWVGLRLKDRVSNIHPMNFGAFVKAPEIVVDVDIPRDGAIRKEVQVLPRGDAYVFSPVLAKIIVDGLDTLYTI